MSDNLGMYTVKRCTGCGRNWATSMIFSTCPACDEPVESVTVTRHRPDERAPSTEESQAELAEIRQAQADQREVDLAAERQRAATLERTITAATAALHYDFDRWITDGADWIAEEGLA